MRCAVEVQRGMAERNASVAPDKRLNFRIGINVGDIIIDGDNIFGDGVNCGALEALADPGRICISRVIRDGVLDKLSFAFEDLGAQEVKNIARPSRSTGYGVTLPSEQWLRLEKYLLAQIGRQGEHTKWRWLAGAAFFFGLAGVKHRFCAQSGELAAI